MDCGGITAIFWYDEDVSLEKNLLCLLNKFLQSTKGNKSFCDCAFGTNIAILLFNGINSQLLIPK